MADPAHEPTSETQTTLRIDSTLLNNFKHKLANSNISISDKKNKLTISSVVSELIRNWPERPLAENHAPQDGTSANHSTPAPRDPYELAQLSRILAESVTTHLTNNQDWATQAILKAQLGLPAGSIFGDRIRHFHDEKDLIAKSFMAWLLKRITHLLNQNKIVYLVLDSGTTLYWLFRELGPAIMEQLDSTDHLGNLRIVTNNLPGVETYIEFGMRNPIPVEGTNSKSPLCDVVACELLSGTVLARYAAVTGDKTDNALKDIKQNAPKNSFFIGLVTGNWLSLTRSGKRPMMPLARGAGHASFKRTLMRESNEVYLVTPLAKVFVNLALKEINSALEHEASSDSTGGERLLYESVEDNEKRGETRSAVAKAPGPPVIVVSTSRSTKSILEIHYARVKAILDVREGTDYEQSCDATDATEIPHLFFPFENPSGMSREDQVKMEFPHENTQSEEFMNKYFGVPPPQ